MIAAMQPIPAEPPIGGPFWTVVVPAALFAIGVTLYAQPMRAAAGELGGICLIKLLLHPLAVLFIATSDVFGLSREEIVAAVLLSSLPVANNVFLIATRYETRPNRVSGAISAARSAPIISPRPVAAPPSAAKDRRQRSASKTWSRIAARSPDPANRWPRAQLVRTCSAGAPSSTWSSTSIAAATRAPGVIGQASR